MALVAAASPPRPRKLRVGVFADALLQPKWVLDAFARVAASDFAVIAALGLAGSDGARIPWLVSAYAGIDRLAFGGEGAEPCSLVEGLPHERLLDPCSAAQLAALELDVAFAVGEVDLGPLERAARHGVWRFCFGARGAAPAAFAGFREVSRGEPLSTSGLEVRRPGEAPRLAYQSCSRTFPHSVARNRAQFLPKTGEFAYRALRELHRCGPAWLESCPPAPSPEPTRDAAPGVLDLARIGGRVLQRAWTRAVFVEQWSLAFRFGEPAGEVPADLAGFTRIMPPLDRDWADPFVLERGGRYFVFFEELPYAARKGHISMIEIEPGGRWSSPVRVLERDYHLSYPFLLEHDGALFMIPESAQNRAVELYRCIDFPLRWRLEKVLLEGVRCVDATLHRAGGRWWMFANAAAAASRTYDDELHLFHAERLFGEWQPHRRSPVKSDARGARPAGALYQHLGALYRPAQICVPRYGAGLAIHRVETLSAHEYTERQVQRVVPSEKQGLLGLHTVNRAGALTVVDAFMQRPRLPAIARSRPSLLAAGPPAHHMPRR